MKSVLQEGGWGTPGTEEALDVRSLSLDEKAALTGGGDTWHTVAVDRVGLPALRLTDGPSGARGVRFTGVTSTSLPCGTALAATWNRELVGQVGELLGDEARRKQAQVLLAPTVNVHRHPLAGRNFECFSEDPYLSAQLAHAYVAGVQSRGVGCAIKHLVGNDQEHDRMEISVDVDERALREIYLPAFETTVRDTGVWAVMAAYNRLHGIHCSEHAGLLEELLRLEWGFDGLVMSDWFGTHSTLAVSAGLDLEMPGPPRFLGDHLVAAVRQGDVDEWVLERAVRRLLGLAARVADSSAASGGDADQAETPAPGEVAARAASEAIVLLRNQGVLPLDPSRSQTIAVVGPKAERPDVQGGGSARVDPPYVISPLEGVLSRVASGQESEGVTVLHEPGVATYPAAPLGRHELRLPGSPDEGLLVEYVAGAQGARIPNSGDGGDGDAAEVIAPGEVVHREVVPETRLFWVGELAPGLEPEQCCTVRARADLVPERSGRWLLALSNTHTARVLLDGETVIDNLSPVRGATFFGQGSEEVEAEVELEAGQRHQLVLELFVASSRKFRMSGIALTAAPPELPEALAGAVAAASEADVAVVLVGERTPASEGHDRASFELPEDQVELIRAVAKVNPENTVVVVNAGAPVAMDWADEVAAVVQAWYLGQETGTALAEVLFGDRDACGRLPTTFPRRLEDTPAFHFFPGDNGRVRYGEGLFVGYRHYDRAEIEPQFCFGHGLSYTDFEYGELVVSVVGEGSLADGGVAVSAEVEVTNVGDRRGSEVVQLYVRDERASVVRPEQELKQFGKIDLEPGETCKVSLELPWRAFAFWDVSAHQWTVEPGRFEIRVGSSSRTIHRTAPVTLPPP